jgi:hypothetical protein
VELKDLVDVISVISSALARIVIVGFREVSGDFL